MFRPSSLPLLFLAALLSACGTPTEPPEATARVAVSVQDRGRTPIAGAIVVITHGTDWRVPRTTSDTGMVEFRGLVPSEYTVAVAVRGFRCPRATTVTLRRHVDLLVSCRPA